MGSYQYIACSPAALGLTAELTKKVTAMVDPYIPYVPPSDRDPRGAFPGYAPSDASALTSRHLWGANNLHGTLPEYLHNDIRPLRSGSYGRDDISVMGGRATPGLDGLASGARAYSPLEDLASLRRDIHSGVKPGIPDIERADPLRRSDSLSAGESNILYVDGLPNDCTKREVGHLFRPFIGFKQIQLVHKMPRHSGDKSYVLCFVEFNDAKCALTAMEALQGYKFDDKKSDAPAIMIRFAKFPFQPPPVYDDRRRSSLH